MAIERRWISCREAGEILSLSAKTINDFCLSGKIPSIKIGHSRRVDLKLLTERLESQAVGRGVGK